MDLSADLAPRSADALRRQLKRLEKQVAYLRSSRATTARAAYAPGTIPNSALRSATAEPGVVQVKNTGFTLTTEPTPLIQASMVVPPGYSTCVVQLTGRLQAINSLAAEGYVTSRITANGVSSDGLWIHATPAGSADNSALSVATTSQRVTGLTSGGGVVVTLDGWVDTGSWAVDPGMFADLSGLVTWVA